MNEEKPIEAFWSGVGVGIVLLFIGCSLLWPALLMSLRMFSEQSKGGTNISQLAIVLLMVGLGICPIIYWIWASVHAFLAKRSYYGMGLLSVILIPLLLFGVCTTLIPPIHISPNRPHHNPPAIDVDTRPDKK